MNTDANLLKINNAKWNVGKYFKSAFQQKYFTWKYRVFWKIITAKPIYDKDSIYNHIVDAPIFSN